MDQVNNVLEGKIETAHLEHSTYDKPPALSPEDRVSVLGIPKSFPPLALDTDSLTDDSVGIPTFSP